MSRRLYKNSVAHYWDRPEAGTGWNQMQRAKRQRELECGFTLFGWDGDTLAWESSPPRDDGDTGRTVHYLYEPGSFVPVAQALRKRPIVLHRQPDWSQREYDFDQDPLWQTEMKPQAFDAIAWYHCDHLGTPMELTDEQGNIAWAGQYKAWGAVREERSEWARQLGLSNPIRFQGQYHDHETGLHYNRHRYYDSITGRFISQDLIKYLGGENLYEYASNPISWIDPLGLARHDPNSPFCQNLKKKIANLMLTLDKRWHELEADEQQLPEYIDPGEKLYQTRRGHRKLINKQDSSLRKAEREYDEACSAPTKKKSDCNCP